LLTVRTSPQSWPAIADSFSRRQAEFPRASLGKCLA
jgi:hypothetical protein